jgi:hypothetical protein
MLPFAAQDLNEYLTLRATGLTRKTVTWLKKAAELFWYSTEGIVSVATTRRLRDYVLAKYMDTYAKRKVLGFTRAFLRYMSKIRFDERYIAFDLFLELPRAVKERKHVTSRIVTKEDVDNILSAIKQAYCIGDIDSNHYLNYTALVLFGAFTGQRPLATIAKLTVGQFREALKTSTPVLDVPPHCDKIKMQHYWPLHPQVAKAMLPILKDRHDDDCVFKQLSFQLWLRHNGVRLMHGGARIVNGDLRKFAEQYGDVIGGDQSNRAYILTHGVSGVEWAHYRHPLPENVYSTYMKSWKNVSLAVDDR